MPVTLNEFSSSYYLLNGIFILRNEYPTLAEQIARDLRRGKGREKGKGKRKGKEERRERKDKINKRGKLY
jgi:hypothetical protein